MPKWNVLLTARALSEVGAPAMEILTQAGCTMVTSNKKGPLAAADIISQLKGVDAALVSPDKFTAEVFASPAAQRLKIVSRWGVGYDSVDIAAATAAGVVVAYTPGALNDCVADYAFSLLCTIARRVHDGHIAMRDGKWTAAWGHDISYKTLGIIGCGRIGQAMAKRAAGFGMKLLGYDVAPNPEAEKLGIRFVPLEELLAQSDFISLHAALTPETKGIISAPQLRAMKRSAYLINTARGAHVDEAALVQALTEGWIAGAAIDAFVTEPLPVGHPFQTTPNLLITPHQASFARETGEAVSRRSAQAIVDLMNGQRPTHVVNESVFASNILKAILRS
ncbi:MAG: phosphoglycerate dehydrogenase [Planctomycetota bacterium]